MAKMLRGLLPKETRGRKQTSQLRIGRLLEFWKTAPTLAVCQGSRRAASQQVKNRRRMPDLAAGPLCGSVSPCRAQASPLADAHAATISSTVSSDRPRARCRRISAGLAAKRHADRAPSQARHLRASREIKCGVAVPRPVTLQGRRDWWPHKKRPSRL